MANVNTQAVTPAGSALTFAPCSAGGDKVIGAGPGVVALFKNDHESNDYVVTINDPNTQGPAGAKAFDPDLEFTVVHGTVKAVPLGAYLRDASDADKVAITYGATPTTMGIAVIR